MWRIRGEGGEESRGLGGPTTLPGAPQFLEPAQIRYRGAPLERTRH